MLLNITTTYQPATDLGYLLHKHPDRAQRFELSFGSAHVFYPEREMTRCTASLLLDIDPLDLARRRNPLQGRSFALSQYVNDRPYAASSFLSVALAKVYGTAMKGRCKQRPALVQEALPLAASIQPVPCRGGAELLEDLFGPLGYRVDAVAWPLDPEFPQWGDSPYFSLTLEHRCRLQDLLSHLYVLLPVLDDEKHYWVGEAEVEKLLDRGRTWLSDHPQKDLITRRYLKHRRYLVDSALAQLLEEDQINLEDSDRQSLQREEELEGQVGLQEQRLGSVLAALKGCGAHRVLDLGCGEGKLLARLLDDRQFTEIVGLDISHRVLEIAAQRLHLERLPAVKRDRIKLMHGSLTYRDKRLRGFDAAAVVEVIEHIEPSRLAAFEAALFEYARPGTVVLTTPNSEYNPVYELPAGSMRHPDHRFEWTRAEFRSWCQRVGQDHGYSVRLLGIGPSDPRFGAPTQMGIFSRDAP